MKVKNKYTYWFEQMVDLMLSMLNNKFIFEKKIDLLEVDVFLNEVRTTGLTICEDNRFVIAMDINPEDDERYIKFVFGHELSHLLFVTVNKLKLSGYSSTDDTFEHTYIQRKTPDGNIYGKYVEELLCDYIGVELVYRCYQGFYSYRELRDLFYSIPNQKEYFCKENYELIKRFIKLFGKELKDLEKIDSYPESDVVSPDNIFLYTAATGELSLLIHDYDEAMGQGAWQELNRSFDEYFLDSSKIKRKEFIENEFKRFGKMGS